MEQLNAQYEMDNLLEELENDYIYAVENNKSETVEAYIEQFLYDSWIYNHDNIGKIKSVLSRYAEGEINQQVFSGSFHKMVTHLHGRLKQLDYKHEYPLLHNQNAASLFVALIDGLVIQYYVGIYNVDQLKDMTPFLKQMIIQTLRMEVDEVGA
ncbi:hypothetical protein [Jeotgalibacillus sp. JSM ZJ347]|uniref:hypothetical protein n=1 Tax=Jeotgalibacillus sp. JSM ZJ347 TaxID=3342117 RepID=UPI0035A81DB7